MAFVVLSESSPRRAMEHILRRTTYILIPFSLLLIRYFPIYGVEYGLWSGKLMWRGVATQKNGLVLLCIIAALFLIWSIVKRWKGNIAPIWKYQTYTEIFVLILTFWLIGGPERSLFYSATSIFSFGIGLLVFLGFHLFRKLEINIKAGALVTIVAIIIIFGVASVYLGGSNVGFFASIAQRDTTLTGRSGVWEKLLPVAMQNPIVGSGFGGFWTQNARMLFEIANAHSGYLDVFLGLGFIGLLLVSIFLLSSCRKAQRELSSNFDWGILWICYIIMAVIHSISESSIDSLTRYIMAVLVFMSISSSKAADAPSDSQEKYEHTT